MRCGNAAAKQLQLDIYGDLMETAWQYAQTQNIDRETGHRLGRGRRSRLPDLATAGFWYLGGSRPANPLHALEGHVLGGPGSRHPARTARRDSLPERPPLPTGSDTIKEFVETNCWSASLRSYTRAAGSEEMDASVLLMALMGYSDPKSARFLGTIDAVRRVLGIGPLLRRYDGADGLAGRRVFFSRARSGSCTRLALAGRLDDAARLMEELLGLANDVGLYAEELDASTGAMLGNFPQGLVHIALVNAASAIAKAAAEFLRRGGKRVPGNAGADDRLRAQRNEMGLTRMDFPFLVGTAFSADRVRAKAVGYVLHFVSGIGFALVYHAVLGTLGRSGWWPGALLGVAHAAFIGTAAVNILLPIVHPRMGSPGRCRRLDAVLEPPGFMMLNYGTGSPAIMVAAHMLYGGIIGYFYP